MAGSAAPAVAQRARPLPTPARLAPKTPATSIRVRIAYVDDAVYRNALATMRRLVATAQRHDCGDTEVRNVQLATKALRYRHLLARALAVDVDDPAFNVAELMGVVWYKAL